MAIPVTLWRQVDPRFPWIELDVGLGGIFPLNVRDTRTGEQARVRNSAELAQFVAAHSASQGHGGLGDLVRGITKFFGLGSCEPCAKRQAALNRMAPRVFRRP